MISTTSRGSVPGFGATVVRGASATRGAGAEQAATAAARAAPRIVISDSARVTSIAPYHRSAEPRRQELDERPARAIARLAVQAHPPSREAPHDGCVRNEMHGACSASYS